MSDDSTVATVHRTSVTDHFLIVPNDHARGYHPVRLHVMARSVLLYLLSLPEGWEMSRSQLDIAHLEGRDAVSKGLRELEENGYLLRTKYQSESGTWVWRWEVTDDPTSHPLTNRTRVFSAWSERAKGESSQVAPSTEIPSTVSQSIPEHGVKNTESKKTPWVRDERKGEEPLPRRAAVAASASAPRIGARPVPRELGEHDGFRYELRAGRFGLFVARSGDGEEERETLPPGTPADAVDLELAAAAFT